MTIIFRRLRDIVADRRGVTALEFAAVAPLVITLQLGTIYLSLMMFSVSALEYAVQEGARCASVQTSICTSAASTQIYTATKYSGLGTPVFTPTTASCGNLVSASLSFSLKTGFDIYTVPLSAVACFPLM